MDRIDRIKSLVNILNEHADKLSPHLKEVDEQLGRLGLCEEVRHPDPLHEVDGAASHLAYAKADGSRFWGLCITGEVAGKTVNRTSIQSASRRERLVAEQYLDGLLDEVEKVARRHVGVIEQARQVLRTAPVQGSCLQGIPFSEEYLEVGGTRITGSQLALLDEAFIHSDGDGIQEAGGIFRQMGGWRELGKPYREGFMFRRLDNGSVGGGIIFDDTDGLSLYQKGLLATVAGEAFDETETGTFVITKKGKSFLRALKKQLEGGGDWAQAGAQIIVPVKYWRRGGLV